MHMYNHMYICTYLAYETYAKYVSLSYLAANAKIVVLTISVVRCSEDRNSHPVHPPHPPPIFTKLPCSWGEADVWCFSLQHCQILGCGLLLNDACSFVFHADICHFASRGPELANRGGGI